METIRLLIIDDCLRSVEKIRSIFRKRSGTPKFEITSTSFFEEAIELSKKIDFDVILTELDVPYAKGEVNISQLRLLWPNTPIVMTGQSNDEKLSASLVRHGAQDYLCKANLTPESVFRSIILSFERYRLTREISDKTSAVAEVERIAHLGSWEHNFRTNSNFSSEELHRIFGFNPETHSNSFAFFIKKIVRDDKKSFIEQIKKVGDGKRSFTIECRIQRHDNSIRNLLTRAEVVTDFGGRPVKIRGTTQDITEIKRAEAGLLSAQLEAERASETKSQFLATMSHEIRTPMNGVIGMTSLLRQTALTPEQKEFVDTIRSSGEHLVEIINDILDFSKIESGKIELEKTRFNIRQIVEETVSLFSEAVTKKQLFFTDILDPKIPIFGVGDPTRMRQILVNLVGNAIKFTRQGEIIIRAYSEAIDETNFALIFAVSDSGVGIAQDKVSKLFQPFSQVDGSITRRFGGTGLGLVITKNLVQLMGGTIEVESTVGLGTTFRFKIALEKSTDINYFAPRPDMSEKKVVVVASNARSGSFIKEQLSLRGCDAIQLNNRESSSWIRKLTSANLIVCDFEKGDRVDLRLTKIFENTATLAEIPRVLLTFNGTCDADKSSYSAVIKKPTRQSEVYQKVVEILSPQVANLEPITSKIKSNYKRTRDCMILVAEDNYVNQRVVGHMLQRLGFRFDTVANGLEAVAAIKNVPYDAVIMDCQMPEMDGFEATRSIRKLKQRRIPIIAVTANAFKGEFEKCLAAGMDHYIAKPLRFEDLEKVLNRFLPDIAPTDLTKIKTMHDKMATLSSNPVVDINYICKNLDLDQNEGREFALELFQMYLANAPEVFDQLCKVTAGCDVLETTKVAHKLRGMSLNLGAFSVAKICEDIELVSREQKMDGVMDNMKSLNVEFSRLVKYLEQNKTQILDQAS